MITQERIRELFEYREDENGGWLYRRKSRGGKLAGTKVGAKHHRNGYYTVKITKDQYYLHRLIWIYHNGSIPEGYQIDHKDRDKSNNRIENLRPATNSQNQMNGFLSTKNTSGVKGVHWHSQRRKWYAYIMIDGKRLYLGYFDTFEDAVAARLTAEKLYFGDYSFNKASAF